MKLKHTLSLSNLCNRVFAIGLFEIVRITAVHRVNFSEILDNLEEHITIGNGTTVEYSLVSKDNLPDDFEEHQSLDDTADSAAPANVSGSRDNASVISVANSSDSDVGKFFRAIFGQCCYSYS